MTKPNTTDIIVVLDRSGSMLDVVEATVTNFNKFVNAQRKEKSTQCTMTLIQFDDRYEVNYSHVPIEHVRELDRSTYQPRGATALLDAIGKAIKDTGERYNGIAEHERPSQVIFFIQTDGHENASFAYNRIQIFDMIRHQRDKYSWEFVFAGANQDAIAAGVSMGIPSTNSVSYINNAQSSSVAFETVTKGLCSFRATAGANRGNITKGVTVDANGRIIPPASTTRKMPDTKDAVDTDCNANNDG